MNFTIEDDVDRQIREFMTELNCVLWSIFIAAFTTIIIAFLTQHYIWIFLIGISLLSVAAVTMAIIVSYEKHLRKKRRGILI